MMVAYLLVVAAIPAEDALAGAWTFFERGGPMMWPLLLCSLIAVAVIFERLFALWRFNAANLDSRERLDEALESVRAGRFEEAGALLEKVHSPLARIYVQALANREVGFEESMQMTAQLELNRLKRGLSILDTAITVAPMLGILGTVTGTIRTFNVLGDTSMDNPLGATAGIAEALITTVAGLSVAIICLFPFNFFVSQIKRRTTELEQAIHQLELAYKMGCAQGGRRCV